MCTRAPMWHVGGQIIFLLLATNVVFRRSSPAAAWFSPREKGRFSRVDEGPLVARRCDLPVWWVGACNLLVFSSAAAPASRLLPAITDTDTWTLLQIVSIRHCFARLEWRGYLFWPPRSEFIQACNVGVIFFNWHFMLACVRLWAH